DDRCCRAALGTVPFGRAAQKRSLTICGEDRMVELLCHGQRETFDFASAVEIDPDEHRAAPTFILLQLPSDQARLSVGSNWAHRVAKQRGEIGDFERVDTARCSPEAVERLTCI